jgi:hypothetical protein
LARGLLFHLIIFLIKGELEMEANTERTIKVNTLNLKERKEDLITIDISGYDVVSENKNTIVLLRSEMVDKK